MFDRKAQAKEEPDSEALEESEGTPHALDELVACPGNFDSLRPTAESPTITSNCGLLTAADVDPAPELVTGEQDRPEEEEEILFIRPELMPKFTVSPRMPRAAFEYMDEDCHQRAPETAGLVSVMVPAQASSSANLEPKRGSFRKMRVLLHLKMDEMMASSVQNRALRQVLHQGKTRREKSFAILCGTSATSRHHRVFDIRLTEW